MTTIIAGSRNINEYDHVLQAVAQSGFVINEVVSGSAQGVDTLGEIWASRHKISVMRFVPDWTVGRYAGFDRNVEMAQYSDALIAIWDGISRGTQHMINTAVSHQLKVFIYYPHTGKSERRHPKPISPGLFPCLPLK